MTVRIISGQFRTRRLHTPHGNESARPLPDRVRTAVFNMLAGHLEGHDAFDAFAGVGSFGLEAISRGVSRCVMVERDKRVLQLLRRNCEELNAGDAADIVPADALGPAALARCPAGVHIVFFDPPFPMLADPAQRKRVTDQFARCIDKLDDTGYAIIRTPWPYVDRPPEHEPDTTHDANEDDAPPEPPPHTEPKPIDLHLPNAQGPETHRYGSMALHWYMRK